MIENEHKICTKSSLQTWKRSEGFKGLNEVQSSSRNDDGAQFLGNFSSTKEYRLILPDDTGGRRASILSGFETFSRNRLENSPRVSIRCYPIQRDRVIFHRSNPPLHYSFAYFALAYILYIYTRVCRCLARVWMATA